MADEFKIVQAVHNILGVGAHHFIVLLNSRNERVSEIHGLVKDSDGVEGAIALSGTLVVRIGTSTMYNSSITQQILAR